VPLARKRRRHQPLPLQPGRRQRPLLLTPTAAGLGPGCQSGTSARRRAAARCCHCCEARCSGLHCRRQWKIGGLVSRHQATLGSAEGSGRRKRQDGMNVAGRTRIVGVTASHPKH
jgi:hypothetical protein